jgi:hypothetical protein
MDDETTPPEPGRLRLVFAAPDKARPIHALRAGTFADSLGRETTFTPDDLRQMAARLNEATQKRRPPINEQHDYGRAVGRMTEAYTRHGDNHLYIVPRWNTEGQRLLAEEVYDAFSIELETGKGYTIIGGALTNYPAVSNLHPVSLSAPGAGAVPTLTLPPADEPAADDTQETPPMPDETQAAPTAAPSVAPSAPPALPPMPTLDTSDPAVRAQFEQYTAEMRAMYQQQYALAQEAARTQARAEFERWRADEERRAGFLAFAQHVTTSTVSRPSTIAYSAEQIVGMLQSPTAEAMQQLLRDALDGALIVSAQAAGSSRGDDSTSDATRFEALVFEQQRAGLSRSEAIKAVSRANPALYNAQSQPKGGR